MAGDQGEVDGVFHEGDKKEERKFIKWVKTCQLRYNTEHHTEAYHSKRHASEVKEKAPKLSPFASLSPSR